MKILTKLHHICFGFIAAFAFTIVFMYLEPAAGRGYGLKLIPHVLLALGVYVLALGKIFSHRHRFNLRGSNRFFWQRRYILAALVMFCVLLAVSLLYVVTVDMSHFVHLSSEGAFTVAEQEKQQESMVNMWVLALGVLFIWYLFFNLLSVGGERGFFRALGRFIRQDTTVFLAYRLVIFLLTLAGAVLMGLKEGGMQSDYFLLAMDDALVQNAAAGSMVQEGDFLGGMTTAASFAVLITMAEETLTRTEQVPFRRRFLRMFLELDTMKLLIVTVLCVLVQGGLLGELVTSFVLFPLWLISMLLFVADTKVLPYLMNFVTLGLVERLIPMSELAGPVGLGLSLAAVTARVVLFSAIAMMIAGYNTRCPRNASVLHRATFLDVCRLIGRLDGPGAWIKLLRGQPLPPQRDEDGVNIFVALARFADERLNRLLKRLQKRLERSV